jgi:hypothetical protein
MLPPNGSLCHLIEHVEGEHRELLPMSACEAVLPLRRPVLCRMLASPTRYRALFAATVNVGAVTTRPGKYRTIA